jgi:hypothetical protein
MASVIGYNSPMFNQRDVYIFGVLEVIDVVPLD